MKLNLVSKKVLVTAYFHEQGSVLKGDAEGFCDGFEVEIQLEGNERTEVLTQLVALARQMCFTEKALKNPTPVHVKQTLNGVTSEL